MVDEFLIVSVNIHNSKENVFGWRFIQKMLISVSIVAVDELFELLLGYHAVSTSLNLLFRLEIEKHDYIIWSWLLENKFFVLMRINIIEDYCICKVAGSLVLLESQDLLETRYS